MELRALEMDPDALSPALRGFVGGNELAPQRFVLQEQYAPDRSIRPTEVTDM
jgi:hypothetical protein